MNIKNIISFTFSVFLILSASVHANEVRWRHESSGVHFLYASGHRTWLESYRFCREKGWDVFNYHYLTEETQKAFRSSSFVRSFQWKQTLKGEPGEKRETRIWMSSQLTPIVTGGGSRTFSSLTMRLFRGDSEPRLETKWASTEQEGIQTLCMYSSHTWKGCHHVVECTFERPGGGLFSHRYSIYEYGETKAVAMKRIRDRAKNIKMVGGRCDLAVRDPHCIDYR